MSWGCTRCLRPNSQCHLSSCGSETIVVRSISASSCSATPELDPAQDQVAYLEHRLNGEGTTGEPLSWEPLKVDGDARVAFFLYYLDTGKALDTPVGPILLPPETERPDRLAFIAYSEP